RRFVERAGLEDRLRERYVTPDVLGLALLDVDPREIVDGRAVGEVRLRAGRLVPAGELRAGESRRSHHRDAAHLVEVLLVAGGLRGELVVLRGDLGELRREPALPVGGVVTRRHALRL